MTDYVSKLGLDIDTSGLVTASQAMDSTTKSADKLEDSANRVQTSFEKASKAIGKLAGAEDPFKYLGANLEIHINTMAEMQGRVEKLRASYDPLGAAINRVEKEIAEANFLFERGAIEYDEYTRAANGLTAKLSGMQAEMNGTAQSSREMDAALSSLGAAIQAVGAKQTAFLQSLNETADTIGKTQYEMLRYKAAQLGVGDAAEAAISKIEAVNAAALRQANAAAEASRAVSALGGALQSVAGAQDGFLRSLQEQSDLLGKSQADVLRYKAAQLGIGEAAEANIRKIEAFNNALRKNTGLKATGEAAKLTAHELLNVQFQLQDLAVQIGSGQGLFRPLLQQLPQIGGVFQQAATRGVSFGTAIKGVAGDIAGMVSKFAPLILGLGAAAGAFGAIVLVMKKMHDGAEESIKVINSLNATSEAAGLTSAKFYALGDSISKATGTSAQSVRSLELEVVRSGQATSESLGLITESSILLSKAMGVDAPNALKTLMPLLGDTQKAAAQLNEQFHFLTVAQYEQIAALQAAGDKAGAVKMAFDLLDKKIGDNVENLGILEKSWKGVGLMIQAAIDKMLQWGRVSTPSDKQAQKVKDLQNEYDILANKIAQTDKGNIGGRGAATDADRNRLTLLGNQLNAWKALNAESAKFDAQQQKIQDVNDALIQYESTGKFGQMNALEEKRSNLEYAIKNHIGDQAKNALLLKATLKEIADLDKSTYGASPKGRTYNLPRFDSADTANAILSFDQAFNKGLYDAMQKGAKIVDAGIKAINTKLADIGSKKILNQNVNGLSSLSQFNDWSDYAQAYKESIEALKEGELLSQQTVWDRYQELQAARLVNEEYEKTIKIGARIKELDRKTVVEAANDNLANASDQFWHDFASGSKDTFRNLGKNLKDIFTEVAAKGLQAGFEPVLKWLKDSLSSVFSDIFSSIKGGFTDLLKKAGVLKTGADGSLSLNTDSLIGKTVKAASTIYAGYQIGQAGANAFGLGGKSAANQQNSQAGGLAGAAIGSFFGGPIGSAIGSFIGSIIGGLLGPKSADNRAAANLTASGSISGSIFGKPTDETSQALTSAIGAIASGYDALKQLGGTLGATVSSLHIGNRDQSQATLSNGQTINAGTVGDAKDLANDALMAVLKATTFTSDALNKIKGGMIAAGSSFDDTYKALSSVQSVLDSVSPAVSDWQKKLKEIDDVFKPLIASTGAYSAALVDAYNTAKTALRAGFDKDIFTQYITAVNGATGNYFSILDEQVSRLKDLTTIGGSTNNVLKLNAQESRNFIDSLNGDYSSIKNITASFNEMKYVMQAAGQDVTDFTKAFNASLSVMADQFNKDIGSQLLATTSPEASQYTAMLKTQADRVAAATSLGADMSQVLALNSAEMSKFIEGLSGSYDNVSDLTKAFDALVSAAQAADQSTMALTQAYEANKATLAANFNTDLSSQIDQLSNPTLASLKALLKTQQDRLANATALGANIVAAERLNALETKDFFSKLTDQQKLSLGDYLGLIEDYTGKIGVVLTQLNDQLTARIDNFEQTKSGLEDTISAFKDIAKSLGDTRNSIIDKYSAATPLARITDLRSQFNELTNKAIGGDQTAAQALPDLANKLIDLSRGLYGSTSKFTADYDLVTKGLADAQTAALTQVDVAQSQLDTLIKQYDILTQIKDALSSSDPNLDYLAQVIGTLDANNADIAAKLTQYLDLQAAQAASNFTAGQIATAAQTTIVQGTATQSPASTPDTAAQQIQVAYLETLVEATASGDAATGEKLDKIYQALTDLTIAIKAA